MLLAPIIWHARRQGQSNMSPTKRRVVAWGCLAGDSPDQLGDRALNLAVGFLSDDPSGVAARWESVDRLADELRPPDSFPYRSPDLRRLRSRRYRVFYKIDEGRNVIEIDHVARLP